MLGARVVPDIATLLTVTIFCIQRLKSVAEKQFRFKERLLISVIDNILGLDKVVIVFTLISHLKIDVNPCNY